MSTAAQALSTQDLQDLDQIRSQLPANDPRHEKIAKLVGANATIPTQFEQERATDTSGPWSRLASGAWEGAKALVPSMPSSEANLSDIPVLGPALGAGLSAAQAYENERKSGQGVLPSMGAAAAGLTGLDAQGIKERAQRGDVAGVIGEGLPAIAGTLIGGEHERIGNGIQSVKDTAGTLLRDKYGRVGPTRIFGTTIPSGVMEAITPDHPNPQGFTAKLPTRMPRVAEPEPELGTQENPGFHSKLPTRMPEVGGAPSMPKPLRPLVGTPADWQAYDQQMNILRPEASDAGTYHAARGSASKRTNLQERIGKKMPKVGDE